MLAEVIQVLLVEDNPTDAIYIQELLDTPNWQITTVNRLQLALAQLSQRTFQIALLDLSLPDSFELNIVVQINCFKPELPLIVLTGLDDEAVGIEAVRLGAQDYLIKGQFDRNLLIKSMRYAMERAASQKTMRQQAAAIAASIDGIAILNNHYQYLYANLAYARFFGYESEQQLPGKPWTLLQLGPHIQPSATEIQTVMNLGRWSGEVSGQRADGAILESELSITMFDQGSIICLVRDIHDRKQAQAEIQNALEKERELNQLKSSFMATISHEFRSPMAGIRLAVGLLEDQEDTLPPEKKDYYLQRIKTSIHEMVQLLDKVLLLHRTQEGGLRYTPVALDLYKFCRELAESIQFNAANSHNIILDFIGTPAMAEMDGVLIRYILTNLLSNAIKYSPQGGNIYFSLHCQDNTVLCTIKDQGIGIAAKDLDRLFEPFYRCSNVGQIPGTGLGLSIVQQCVDLHQGTIHVESQVGFGTMFRITLPLRPVFTTQEDT